MIVPAFHLAAAARGVDVSTPDKMRLFAEAEYIKVHTKWNEAVTRIAELEREVAK